MKLYFAGPLFTTAERAFNADLAARLDDGGHDVFLPQARGFDDEAPPGAGATVGEGATPAARTRSPEEILRKNLRGLDWAEAVVAIMDGPDPDSGTAWECGYAYARGKPQVLLRTDFRAVGDAGRIPYNAMLVGAADVRLEIALGSPADAAVAILAALAEIERRRAGPSLGINAAFSG
jgi:nucleoside 2-deoxyribosyltransferase